MSKNVAVFVDVANIFYAAKAAGVDIDYVTLLKSATAGRDFVRAYAYTGLDPDNENQRQFHSFLGRSGYKVVSKDIRKYGDGRIKANLDIELVVDMMRIAQHIDIAVVVSGDGDFAPAIRAVQQLGVRCEVISFRGNTSSDLIDVADVFTDITQIARVEKGARSGRRIAAEGDLSMTEVPEKETEGLTRRRRGRRGEREERMTQVPPAAAAVAAPVAGMPGNLIVLPGEKLSRAVGDEPSEAAEAEEIPGESPGEELTVPAGSEAEALDEGEGRRRRRRRGGRGRGRGRAETEAQPVGEAPIEDEEYLEEEIAPLPQHSTFGSVWDSQMGVPAAPQVASAAPIGTDEEEYEDEPEIPEYLLAERRQRARGGNRLQRGRPGGARAGYQSAVDRERYGRSGTSAFGGGAGAYGGGPNRDPNRVQDRGRGPAGRGPRPQPAPQQRQSRPAPVEQPREERSSAQSQPWSEVPPEVQELLKAELARRQAAKAGAGSRQSESAASPVKASSSPVAGEAEDGLEEAAADVQPSPDMPVETVATPPAAGRGRGTRSRRHPTPAAEAVGEARPDGEAESPVTVTETPVEPTEAAPAAELVAGPPASRRRTATRGRGKAVVESPAVVDAPPDAPAEVQAESGATEVTPAKTPRRGGRRPTATPPPTATGAEPETVGATPEEAASAAPRRRRTTVRRVAASDLPDGSSESAGTADTPPAPRTRRRTARSAAADTGAAASPDGSTPGDGGEA